MENINLWESNMKDKYLYFDSLSDYFKYLIENNRYITFDIKDKFIYGDDPKNILEQIAFRNNIDLTFTDASHPIVVSRDVGLFSTSFINSKFLDEHKNEFIKYVEYYYDNIDSENIYSICIPDFTLTDTLFRKIIDNPKFKDKTFRYFMDNDIPLADDQIKAIKQRHLDFYVDNEQISTKYVLPNLTIDQLKTNDIIYIKFPLTDEQINNFSFINELASINIEFSSNYIKDEESFFKQLAHCLKILGTHNRKYNISFDVQSRESFRKSGIIDNITDNINLKIKNDNYEYDVDTFKLEEDKLESIAAPIRDSKLSPLEKYLAVYDVVKKFKKYKEKESGSKESRYLRYILDNEFIVCVGFAKLLTDLTDRVGIPCITINASVDTSYDQDFTMDDTTINRVGHARNLVKIDDDKYDVHGIYLADATWDNDLESNLYLNSIMTFDRKKEARRLESLSNIDLLFDFHNEEEFYKKAEYYIKKEAKNSYGINDEDKRKDACRRYYNNVLDVLYILDYEQYSLFYKKYYNDFSEIMTTDKKFYAAFNKMLSDYASYIILKSNNNINISTIIDAASEVRKQMDRYTDSEVKEWALSVKRVNESLEKKSFPYQYNPNNPTEAFLTDRNNIYITDHKENSTKK